MEVGYVLALIAIAMWIFVSKSLLLDPPKDDCSKNCNQGKDCSCTSEVPKE
jgi:hypothetical protein